MGFCDEIVASKEFFDEIVASIEVFDYQCTVSFIAQPITHSVY